MAWAVLETGELPEARGCWGLFRRLQVPGRGRTSVLRLILEDVPPGTKAADIFAALQAAGESPRFSEAKACLARRSAD